MKVVLHFYSSRRLGREDIYTRGVSDGRSKWKSAERRWGWRNNTFYLHTFPRPSPAPFTLNQIFSVETRPNKTPALPEKKMDKICKWRTLTEGRIVVGFWVKDVNNNRCISSAFTLIMFQKLLFTFLCSICMLSGNELLLNKHRLKSWFPFVYLGAGRIHTILGAFVL